MPPSTTPPLGSNQPSSRATQAGATVGNETCPAELPNFCAQRHWAIFWILILCSVSVLLGRTINARNFSTAGESAFYSANDRSRWCTIRALGDEGTFEIDEVIERGQPIHWDTIDKVQHVGSDGKLHFYSSKPTLLPTMAAGVYVAIKWVTGKTLADDPLLVARAVLVFTNVIPWGVFLYFLALTINGVPVRDWVRYYVLACGGFATFLSTFSISLNNHVPAATCVMISLYSLSVIWRTQQTAWRHYVSAGLFGAMAAAFDLPALSFVALVGLLCLCRSPLKTFGAFAPAALVIAAAAMGTNYWAHGQWKPAYAHRGDGATVALLELDTASTSARLDGGSLPSEILRAAQAHFDFKAPTVEQGAWPSTPEQTRRWVVRDQLSATQFSVVLTAATETGSPSFEIRDWNNWYDYPGSYWLTSNDENKSLVDRGQAALEVYTFHLLFGHHGIFSLTPIWLFSLAGMIGLLMGAKIAGRFQMRWLGFLAVVLSLVVIAFYLRRPVMDRNYGGVTSGLRWVFWLAPIWLTSMLPVVDWLAQSKSGKAICYSLFFISAVSAMVSMNNPWVHPWLYELWDLTGLPK